MGEDTKHPTLRDACRSYIDALKTATNFIFAYLGQHSAEPPIMPKTCRTTRRSHYIAPPVHESRENEKLPNLRHKMQQNANNEDSRQHPSQMPRPKIKLTYLKLDRNQDQRTALSPTAELAKQHHLTMTTETNENSKKTHDMEEPMSFEMLINNMGKATPKSTPNSVKHSAGNEENAETDTKREAPWQKVARKPKQVVNYMVVPKTMPRGTLNRDGVEPASKYRIPINIRIAKPKGARGEFNVGRILQAMMSALQEVHPSTVLLSYNNKGPQIENVDDLPEEETQGENYMEDPTTVKYKEFLGRMQIQSNIELNEYKRNTTFVNWLSKEQISVDRSDLRTTKPTGIGFVLFAATAGDLLDVQRARFSKQMPECPPFQLSAQWLKDEGDTHSTRVIHVSTDPDEEDDVIDAFHQLNMKQRRFYTWDEYRALNMNQQITVIAKQNEFRAELFSYIFTGFTNEASDTVMRDDEPKLLAIRNEQHTIVGWKYLNSDEPIKDRNVLDKCIRNHMNLTMTTIHAFMMKEYKSGDGTALFNFVHESVGGTIEVLVTKQHQPETRRLQKRLLADLCRYMSNATVRTVFQDPDDIMNEMYTGTKWAPFNIQSEIEETHDTATVNSNQRYAKKRKTQKFTPSPTMQRQRADINYNEGAWTDPPTSIIDTHKFFAPEHPPHVRLFSTPHPTRKHADEARNNNQMEIDNSNALPTNENPLDIPLPEATQTEDVSIITDLEIDTASIPPARVPTTLQLRQLQNDESQKIQKATSTNALQAQVNAIATENNEMRTTMQDLTYQLHQMKTATLEKLHTIEAITETKQASIQSTLDQITKKNDEQTDWMKSMVELQTKLVEKMNSNERTSMTSQEEPLDLTTERPTPAKPTAVQATSEKAIRYNPYAKRNNIIAVTTSTLKKQAVESIEENTMDYDDDSDSSEASSVYIANRIDNPTKANELRRRGQYSKPPAASK